MDAEEILRRLIDKPQALYYLYKLDPEGWTTQLPQIINRKDENIDLLKMGLIEKVSSKKKHLHLTRLISDGVEFIDVLKMKGIYAILKDIPVGNEVEFKYHYENRLRKLTSLTSSIKSSFGFQQFGSKLTQIKETGRIQGYGSYFTVHDYKLIKIDPEKEEWSVEMEFHCEKCHENSRDSVSLMYDLNSDDRNPHDVSCSNCGKRYKLCKGFNCFYYIGS